MNTRFTTLVTLAALATLAPACDVEPTSASDVSLRDGEIIVPPTGPIGGTLKGTGGHDLPWEALHIGFDRASSTVQNAFLGELELQIHAAFTAEFLANEGNYEECPWACDELGMAWDEGVNVQDIRFEHGAVTLGECTLGAHWETEVSANAQVGCACK